MEGVFVSVGSLNGSCFSRFPLFTAIHKICTGVLKPAELIESIRTHPEHM